MTHGAVAADESRRDRAAERGAVLGLATGNDDPDPGHDLDLVRVTENEGIHPSCHCVA